jgi:hypothetical protein
LRYEPADLEEIEAARLDLRQDAVKRRPHPSQIAAAGD